jgi:hypothetical protein
MPAQTRSKPRILASLGSAIEILPSDTARPRDRQYNMPGQTMLKPPILEVLKGGPFNLWPNWNVHIGAWGCDLPRLVRSYADNQHEREMNEKWHATFISNEKLLSGSRCRKCEASGLIYQRSALQLLVRAVTIFIGRCQAESLAAHLHCELACWRGLPPSPPRSTVLKHTQIQSSVYGVSGTRVKQLD